MIPLLLPKCLRFDQKVTILPWIIFFIVGYGTIGNLSAHTTRGVNQSNNFTTTYAVGKVARNESSPMSRVRRGIVQLAGMINCLSGCDPLSLKGYGCYCGYLGSGLPVDPIDRCCLEHDWCYSLASCHQLLLYFMPYQWVCLAPGIAECGNLNYGNLNSRCSFDLCECDRSFGKCLSKFECPKFKAPCQRHHVIGVLGK